MQLAILIVSSASLICSAGCLCVMLKAGKDVKGLQTKVETDVADVKTKTNAALGKLRVALDGLEL